ncbi:MAG: ABC transporter substrate-binding protein, partial [Acetobacteraceae bacterium]|nr:ABC transporter substrate-binding protein [Acetobacteraceae bacterium]
MRTRTTLFATCLRLAAMPACLCLAAVPAFLGLAAVPALAQRTLNVAVGGAFTSMDPHYHNLNPNNAMTDYVFEPLVRADPQFKPSPGLAVSWTAVDPTTWEFKLRDGVTFSDGTPFTADDVVFSFARIPTILNSPSSFNFAVKPIQQIEVVDAHTLRFHSAAPVALMPYLMASPKIVSRKNGEGAGTGDYNTMKAAIGTGPYRVTTFVVGDHAVFERNRTWWGPKLAWDTVNYRVIPNDAARDAALQAGDVDVIDQVPPRDVAGLRSNPKLTVISQPGQRLIYIQPDIGRAETPWVTDTAGKKLDKNPLQDVRVRHALSLAINRDAIRDRVMDGFSAPTGQVMPEGASGYDAAIKPDPYDPATAKKLLAEAGYPDGFGITLHGPNDRYVNDSKLVEAVAQMWTRIGVKTQVDTMPAAAYFSRATRFEFSIRLAGWASDTGEASSNLVQLIASSNPGKGRGAILDPTHFGDPKVDALVEQSLATVDADARETLFRQATEMAMPQVPIIPLHFQVNIWAIRKGLTFHVRSYEGTRAWDIDP